MLLLESQVYLLDMMKELSDLAFTIACLLLSQWNLSVLKNLSSDLWSEIQVDQKDLASFHRYTIYAYAFLIFFGISRNHKHKIQLIFISILAQNIRAFVKKNQKPYKNKDIAIIVFDLSNRETFEHVDYWFSRAKNFAAKETVFALLGNKKDLVREISEEEAREKAEKWAAIYMEVSALTGENINDVFRNTSEEVVWNIRRNYSKITEKF
ncbi:unnamed protein product [Blepharisma stoltei]|uniref:Uncharacterized protein n=1 Tax=Blepharisma stoltei TaxID=1481888 RepID=A0AAU9IU18_9CILI|nr:unnamed protein product [Blepharisma stoltei]